MSNLINWSKSDCKEGWLHRYKILRQDNNYVEEGCEICRKRIYFKIINGKIDNISYLKHHLRNALPKYHKLFNREYGKQ